MSLIQTSNFNIVLQSIKKLLSFKADKEEVVFRDEVEESKAIELVTKVGFVSPATADGGSIYTDEKGVVYTL